MVKILKKRNKIKCNVCKSKLTFEPEDVQEKHCKLSNTYEVNFYYIICPVCKAKVLINKQAIIF